MQNLERRKWEEIGVTTAPPNDTAALASKGPLGPLSTAYFCSVPLSLVAGELVVLGGMT